jgi:hypothetical protein
MPIQMQILERRQVTPGNGCVVKRLGHSIFDQSDRIMTTDPAGIGPCRRSQSFISATVAW